MKKITNLLWVLLAVALSGILLSNCSDDDDPITPIVVPDTSAPSISITSPANGVTLTEATFQLQASAMDNVDLKEAIIKVTNQADGSTVFEKTNAISGSQASINESISFDAPDGGDFLLDLTVSDQSNNSSSSSIFVQVAAPVVAKVTFELWVTDQALNTVHVLDGNTLELKEVIDIALAGASKPHMALFSPDRKFAYIACVGGDGATVIVRTSDYKVITTLATGKSSHASIPSFDGSRFWVAAIGEKTLREVMVDGASETFTMTRELDLAAALPDTDNYPASSPICHMFTLDDKSCYVTLGGGGLAVVDVASMTVSKSYPVSQVKPAGCGLINGPPGSNIMFANSGTSTTGNFYMFNSQNHDLMLTLDTGADGLDAHGVAISPDETELWMVNRHSDNIRIFDMASQQFTETIPDVGDSPDLLVFSPDGTKVFLSLRGNAQTGPHANSGIQPGIAVIDVATRVREKIVPIGSAEGSDPHGINLLLID